jgi:hypothetical protein
MFDFSTNAEERSDEGETAHEIAELLNRFVTIDGGAGRDGLHVVKDELADKFRNIELIRVKSDDAIGIGHHRVDFIQHPLMTMFPFREQVNLLLTEPFCSDTEKTTVFYDLFRTDILFKSPPD